MTTPPIDTTQLPADVRAAGPKAQQLYATALQFEQLLLEQLTQQLDPNADGSGDGSDGGDGTTALYQQMLPGALAQGITDAGGIGLARQLYDSLQLAQGVQAPASAAPATGAQAQPAQPDQPVQPAQPAASTGGAP